MNLKISNLMTILLISLLFCTAASCQEKQSEEKKTGEVETNEINEKDFDEILTNAKKDLDGKTYRLTETEKFYSEENAEPEKSEIDLLEIVQPDKRREIKEIKSSTKNSREERIWDGKNLYVKNDDKKWEKFGGGGGSTGGDFRSGRTTKVYRFLGATETDGQRAKLYSEEKKRIANKPTRYSSYQVYSYENTKYWFAENGLLLRIEKEEGVEKVVTDEGVKTPKSIIKKVSVYEYDPNIKIETPIITEMKK